MIASIPALAIKPGELLHENDLPPVLPGEVAHSAERSLYLKGVSRTMGRPQKRVFR